MSKPTGLQFGLRWMFGILIAAGLVFGTTSLLVRRARAMAKQLNCANNMKNVILACHNHESAHRRWPAAVHRDATGQALHGWRIALQPYMESARMYPRLHMDQSWDSPANKPWREMHIRNFQCPCHGGGSHTNYVAVVGPGTVWDEQRRFSLGQVSAEWLASTIVLIELPGTGIHWFSPQDIPISEFEKSPNEVFTAIHRGGANVGYADGHVEWLSLSQLGSLTPDDFRIRR